MPVAPLLLAVLFAAAEGPTSDGCIGGVVVNSSRDGEPVAGARVVLEIKSDQDYELLDEATTDAAGRFLFRNLLVSQYVQYRASAQYAEIHYPGPCISLAGDRDTAAATLAVREVVQTPNPLRVRQHEIHIRSATGMLEVTESLTVDNATRSTYVGPAPAEEGAEPVTLQLSIPADFQKVTFLEEFFGRSFAVREGKLVTAVPWEPGQRVVTFTYWLRNSNARTVWERPLDLPTDKLTVAVAAVSADHVASNLSRVDTTSAQGTGDVLFAADRTPLPAGHVVQCTLGALPVPWMVYGRWGAAATLMVLIGCGALVRRRRPPPVITPAPEPALTQPLSDMQREAQRRARKRTRRAA